MKNKKGFTLVELLAVIALLGVILMLVVPNVLGLFKSAKRNLFVDEVLNIYNTTYSTYVYRSSEGDYTKRFCSGKDTSTNKIDIENKDGFYYDLTVNEYGEILSLKVSNGEFGMNLSSSSGVKKKHISTDNITDPFEINCNGSGSVPDNKIVCIITNTKRECTLFDFSYKLNNETL